LETFISKHEQVIRRPKKGKVIVFILLAPTPLVGSGCDTLPKVTAYVREPFQHYGSFQVPIPLFLYSTRSQMVLALH
jgi:hypothetical protein